MKVFKAESIQNIFASAGLVLFNPDIVPSQLDIQLKTSVPLDSQ